LPGDFFKSFGRDAVDMVEMRNGGSDTDLPERGARRMRRKKIGRVHAD